MTCAAFEFRGATSGSIKYQTYQRNDSEFVQCFTGMNTNNVEISECNMARNVMRKYGTVNVDPGLVYVRDSTVFIDSYVVTGTQINDNGKLAKKYGSTSITLSNWKVWGFGNDLGGYDYTINNCQAMTSSEETIPFHHLNLSECAGNVPVSQLIITSIFSASVEFTLTEDFSNSIKFSNSKEFSKTNDFSNSKQFTLTDEFSKTTDFTNSVKFSNSKYFSESTPFSFSKYFTKSTYFSGSNEFTKTVVFSETTDFTESTAFSETNDFTKSIIFSDSSYFSSSFYFSQSTAFSKTTEFTKTDQFTETADFSLSTEFTQSEIFPLLIIGISLILFHLQRNSLGHHILAHHSIFLTRHILVELMNLVKHLISQNQQNFQNLQNLILLLTFLKQMILVDLLFSGHHPIFQALFTLPIQVNLVKLLTSQNLQNFQNHQNLIQLLNLQKVMNLLNQLISPKQLNLVFPITSLILINSPNQIIFHHQITGL